VELLVPRTEGQSQDKQTVISEVDNVGQVPKSGSTPRRSVGRRAITLIEEGLSVGC